GGPPFGLGGPTFPLPFRPQPERSASSLLPGAPFPVDQGSPTLEQNPDQSNMSIRCQLPRLGYAGGPGGRIAMNATTPREPQPEPIAPGILSVHLHTHRLAELRAFYREKLHFPIMEETGDSVTFQAGATALTFVRTPEEHSRPFYHFAFNIPENKLPAAKEW